MDQIILRYKYSVLTILCFLGTVVCPLFGQSHNTKLDSKIPRHKACASNLAVAKTPNQKNTELNHENNSLLKTTHISFLDLLEKQIIPSRCRLIENPVAVSNKMADPASLKNYTIEIKHLKDMQLLQNINVKGEKIYRECLSKIDTKKIYNTVSMQRKAIYCLMSYIESLLLENFFANSNIKISKSDFDTSINELEKGFKAFVVTYRGDSRKTIKTTGKRYRLLMRPEEHKEGLSQKQDTFIEDCIRSLKIDLAKEYLLKLSTSNEHIEKISSNFFSEPTEENLLRLLYKTANINLIVPDLCSEETLDLIVKLKEKGICVSSNISGNMFNRSHQLNLSGQKKTSPKNIRKEDTMAIRDYYANNPLCGFTVLQVQIDQSGEIANIERNATFGEDKKFCVIHQLLLAFGDPWSIDYILYFDGAYSWSQKFPEGKVVKTRVPRKYTVNYGSSNIGNVLALQIPNADRSYYIEGVNRDYAVYELHHEDKKSGSRIFKSYYVRLDNNQLVKFKEVIHKTDGTTLTQMFLFSKLFFKTHAVEYIERANKYFSSKEHLGVSQNIRKFSHKVADN